MGIKFKVDVEWKEYTVIGIVGSRRRDTAADFKLVKEALFNLIKEHDLNDELIVLCSGGCPKGGDRFAEKLAKDNGLPILIHYANWNKYDKRAGFIRNSDIADDSDFLIACVAGDRKGGTEDTVLKFGQKSEVIFV